MPLKILFVSYDTSQTRHFLTVFRELLDRGHDLEVMVKHKGPPLAKLPTYLRHLPTIRLTSLIWPQGLWGRHARSIRAARNYFLYYHPHFANATVFRQRGHERVDPALRRFIPADGKAPFLTERVLKAVEEGIPPDPAILAYMRDGGYDLLLVSPFIFNESTVHLDYVKCADALGIPVGFPVFSWDNLTTKGMLQIAPDRIWVWNEIQKRELAEFHGADPETVGVVGAYRFDEYREFRPAKSREQFAAELGLDPARPMIVYLGSSPAVAPDEGELVVQWIRAVRASADPVLAGASLLIRSHPRNAGAWANLDDIVGNPGVAFQKPQGSLLWETQNLFDTLTYAKATVGLNTSAMLEAAIHGLPVHTVRHESAHRGQEGTVHYRYLTEAGGGLLYEAADLDEHCSLLSASLARPDGARDPKSAAFEKAFLEPVDDGRSATVRITDEIEALAGLSKRPRARRRSDDVVERITRSVLDRGWLDLAIDPDHSWYYDIPESSENKAQE